MNELYNFVIFILTGMCIGLLFDIFRILRQSFKTTDFITYIQDIVFWILTGIIVLYSIFTFNKGDLRGYVFIGIISGIIIYMFFISKIIVNIMVKIITTLKNIVLFPIKLLFKLLKKWENL